MAESTSDGQHKIHKVTLATAFVGLIGTLAGVVDHFWGKAGASSAGQVTDVGAEAIAASTALREQVASLTTQLNNSELERDDLTHKLAALEAGGTIEQRPPVVSLSLLSFNQGQQVSGSKCKRLAASVLADAGAAKIDQSAPHTVYAVEGGYTLFVVCSGESEVALAGVAGPEVSVSLELQSKIGDGMRAGLKR